MSWGYNGRVRLPKSLRVWLRDRRHRKDRKLAVRPDMDPDEVAAVLRELKRGYLADHEKILKG